MKWISRLGAVIGLVCTSASAHLDELQVWANAQVQLSESKMYANISPAGAVRGVIIASPEKVNPNYYYYWVRDGALVMRSVLLLREATGGAEREKHDQTLLEYVKFSRANQATTGFEAMGEPRFNTDGTVNTEPWGRPQYDGPALRALTLIRYARALLKEGKKDFVTANLYSNHFPADTVIKTDLEFVGHHWTMKCIDIWEEIWGQHFFTRATELAALREGAAFADELGDEGAAKYYAQEADLLQIELAKHWSPDREYYLATVDSNAGPDHQKPSQLDTAVLLGALAGEQTSGPLAITDGKMLSTAAKIEQSFASFYAINKNKKLGTAIGRYTEDYYYGGNPWVLTTAAYAELSYKLAAIIRDANSFKIDANQTRFFAEALKDEGVKVADGVDLAAVTAKADVVRGLITYGDKFLERIRASVGTDGGLSEQYGRDNGAMLSARDLTWSYASFIRAISARSAVSAPPLN